LAIRFLTVIEAAWRLGILTAKLCAGVREVVETKGLEPLNACLANPRGAAMRY